STSFSTSACVQTDKFGRAVMGRKKALEAFHRHPDFWLTSKYPTPSLSPQLKSSFLGTPDCTAASAKRSRMSHLNRCFSTRHSPPWPCISENRPLPQLSGSAPLSRR